MNKIYCDTIYDKFWLSYLCTNGSDTKELECYNDYYTENKQAYVFRTGLGIWFITVGILGSFGNFYTLLSIPHSARKKKFGLDKNFRTNTIFILNLCFIDLCNCMLYIFPHGIVHLTGEWPFPPFGCSFVVLMGMLTVSGDAIALAFVALTRSLNTHFPKKWSIICERKRNISLMFLSIWLISGIQIIPFAFKSYGMEFGWDCDVGGCGYRQTCMIYENETVPRSIRDPEYLCDSPFYSNITFVYSYSLTIYIISMILIGASYFSLLYKAHLSRKNLQQCENDERLTAALDKRERHMTWTILILILLNLLCWLPYQLSNIYIFVTRSEHSKTSENFYFDVFIGIFFTQYSLNFFVYIVRSDQYQKAFLYFWYFMISKVKTQLIKK